MSVRTLTAAAICAVVAGAFAFGYFTADYDRFLNGFMTVILVSLPFLLAMLGFITAWAAAPAGRFALVSVTLVVALIPAFLGYLLGDMMGGFRDNLWGWVGGAIGFVFCLAPSLVVAGSGKYIRANVAQSAAAAKFAVANFDALRDEKSGEITRASLHGCWTRSWTDAQRLLLVHLDDNWDDLGHVVATKNTPSMIIVPIGGVMMPMASNSTTTIRAVSLEDLRTYPERLRTKWAKWL